MSEGKTVIVFQECAPLLHLDPAGGDVGFLSSSLNVDTFEQAVAEQSWKDRH